MSTLMIDLSKVSTQRDYMRMLARKYGRNNWRLIVRNHALAERKGRVIRMRNSHGLPSIEYAQVLYNDMIYKGW